MSDPTTKVRVLVSAKVLKQLLADTPDVEIELVKGASAQVAADFKKKVSIESIVDKVIIDINSKLNYKYHLPDQVIKVIKEAVADKMTEKFVEDAKKAALDAMAKNLTYWWEQNQKALESRIETLASKKIGDMLNAMSGFNKRLL